MYPFTPPGASFVVNGARQASDAALLTASAEKKWLNGWSAAGTFEGEFSSVLVDIAADEIAEEDAEIGADGEDTERPRPLVLGEEIGDQRLRGGTRA